jgi:hypothetical protein
MWSDLPPPIQRAVVAMVRSAVASKKPAAANGKARSAVPAKGPSIAPTAPLREPSLAAVAPHRIAKTAGR